MHRQVSRSDIVDRVERLRGLHRQNPPTDESERIVYERREQKTKDLLSNLRRTSDRPTLSLIKEFGELNALTVDGAHRLFGYDLDAVRDYDLLLNGGRTHIECLH